MISLGKVIQSNFNLTTGVKNWNFKSINSDISKKIGLQKASVYYDEKSKKLLILIKISHYQAYEKISAKNPDEWWANLKPIKDIKEGESWLDYAWSEVFNIEDNIDK